jgi:hypothetical protein
VVQTSVAVEIPGEHSTLTDLVVRRARQTKDVPRRRRLIGDARNLWRTRCIPAKSWGCRSVAIITSYHLVRGAHAWAPPRERKSRDHRWMVEPVAQPLRVELGIAPNALPLGGVRFFLQGAIRGLDVQGLERVRLLRLLWSPGRRSGVPYARAMGVHQAGSRCAHDAAARRLDAGPSWRVQPIAASRRIYFDADGRLGATGHYPRAPHDSGSDDAADPVRAVRLPLSRRRVGLLLLRAWRQFGGTYV